MPNESGGGRFGSGDVGVDGGREESEDDAETGTGDAGQRRLETATIHHLLHLISDDQSQSVSVSVYLSVCLSLSPFLCLSASVTLYMRLARHPNLPLPPIPPAAPSLPRTFHSSADMSGVGMELRGM